MIEKAGTGPFIFDLAVGGATTIKKGRLVSQLLSGGAAVPYATASSGVCVGVSEFEVVNAGSAGDKRIRVETKRAYILKNGAGGDAFSEASLIGSVVYGSDDETAADNSDSGDRQAVGFFLGMESDGRVRVWVDPTEARIVAALQALADTPASADALRDAIVAAFG